MNKQNELIGKVEALAAELLRGTDVCAEDAQTSLAIVMSDAAEGLLALLDVLAGATAGAICGETTPAQ